MTYRNVQNSHPPALPSLDPIENIFESIKMKCYQAIDSKVGFIMTKTIIDRQCGSIPTFVAPFVKIANEDSTNYQFLLAPSLSALFPRFP